MTYPSKLMIAIKVFFHICLICMITSVSYAQNNNEFNYDTLQESSLDTLGAYQQTPISENYNTYDENEFITEKDLSPIVYSKKNLDQNRWNKIVAADDYNYILKERTVKKSENNFLKSFIESIITFFNSSLGYFVAILIIATLLVIIIYYITKNKQFLFKNKMNSQNETSDGDAFEAIPDNWELAIENAINNKDYKSAIAYKFRYLLTQLSNDNLIQFQSHKTNTHYYYELSSTPIANQFKQLSAIFNEAKYGYKPISQEHITTYQVIDQELQQKLPTK